MHRVEFRGEHGDVLTVSLIQRSLPDSTDYWDGNWIRTSVAVVAGGFRGLVDGELRADEVRRFYDQFAQLQESLRGKAELKTIEEWLSIQIEADGKGHMDCTCILRDRPGTGNRLRVSIASDQTFTRSALDECRVAIEAFPVIGRP